MKLSRTLLFTGALASVAIVTVAAMQTPTQKPAAGAQQPGKPTTGTVNAAAPAPKVMPEHANLRKLVGTWDATVSTMMPGTAATTSKGSATYKTVGDTWVASEFTGEMMGAPFTGHGVDGYDTAKNKFVSVWVDSMSTEMMIMEGTHDASAQTTTMTGECRDQATGKMVPHRMVTEMKNTDAMVMHMYMPGPDGKEAEVMKIDYKRKK